MSEEIKKEKSKTGVAYTIIAIAVVIICGLMLYKTNNNTNVRKQEIATATNADIKEEGAVAHIELFTKLVNADIPQFEIYVDDSEIPEQAGWMPKFDRQGYVFQRNNGQINVTIIPIEDEDINIKLQSPFQKDEDGNVITKDIKYTSLTINDEQIIDKVVVASYKQPFIHVIRAKSGKPYNISISWTPLDK